MTWAVPAFINLLHEYLNREAVVKFCQGCSDKSATQHACLTSLNHRRSFKSSKAQSVRISLKRWEKTRKDIVSINTVRSLAEDYVAVNAEQCPLEDRVEKLRALQQFAERIQVQTDRIADTKKRKASQCFFCKKFGHMKRVQCTRHGLVCVKQEQIVQATRGQMKESHVSGQTIRDNWSTKELI